MRLVIKMMSGKSFDIEVEPNDLIETVRAKIHEKEHVSPEMKQRLVFEGKQLEDDRILADYGINEESTLFFIVRPPGI